MRERKKKPCLNKGKLKQFTSNPIARLHDIIEQQIFHKINKICCSSGLKFLWEGNILIRPFVYIETNKSFDYHNTILTYTRRV